MVIKAFGYAAGAVLFGMLLCVACIGHAASLAELMTVNDIKVDTTEKNSSIAKRNAMNTAQGLAFFTLLERLTMPEDFAKLPVFPSDTIANTVKHISVRDEKTSGTRYLATMDIRFDEDAVFAALTEYGVPFVKEISVPVLLLPTQNNVAYADGGAWLTLWQEGKYRSNFIPFIVPNAKDMEGIGIYQLQDRDPETLNGLLAKYKARKLYLATIDSRNSVKVALWNGEEVEDTYAFSGSTMEEAAKTMTTLLDNAFKGTKTVNFKNETIITVVIPITKMSDWINISGRLSGIPTITGHDLKAARKDKVQIELRFAGSIEELARVLKNRGLDLFETAPETYGLKML